MASRLLAAVLASIGWILACTAASARDPRPAELPNGFVYLRDVAPQIQQDIRYASNRNFLGRPVAGYEARECVLTRATAHALRAVQARMPAGKALKVYDCYRPERAVADFARWARDVRDQKAKAEYYPTVDKTRLFELGYISRGSTHSRGTAVDLTIVDLDSRPSQDAGASDGRGGACFGPQDQRAYDNSLDFGTGYDCFHALSATAHPDVSETARRNRGLLLREMSVAGFENYHREWWHFDFHGEPSRSSFDFPIRDKAPPTSKSVQRTDPANATGELGSRAQCGEQARVKIVCASGGARIAAYAGPSSKSRLIAHFPATSADLECRRCLGDLPAYSQLNREGRTHSPPPWCLVEHVNEDGTGSRIGWVSARNLAPAGAAQIGCAQ